MSLLFDRFKYKSDQTSFIKLFGHLLSILVFDFGMEYKENHRTSAIRYRVSTRIMDWNQMIDTLPH